MASYWELRKAVERMGVSRLNAGDLAETLSDRLTLRGQRDFCREAEELERFRRENEGR